jgi:ubiquitin-protein ligase
MMRIVNEMLELGRMHKEYFSVTLPEEWDLYSLRVVFRGDVRTNYNEEEYGV